MTRARFGPDVQRAANAWDRFYARHEAPWRGQRPVQHMLPWLGDGPVLELGCGNGKLLRPLVAAGVEVIGIDISWHALRRLEHAALALADAATLPFRDGAFSAVLDIHCTGHLDGRMRAAAALETQRVLRPGGIAWVERLGTSDLRASQGQEVVGEPGMRSVSDGRRTHFSSVMGLAAELQGRGLEVLGGMVERHYPGHGTRQVTREAVTVLARKPDE